MMPSFKSRFFNTEQDMSRQIKEIYILKFVYGYISTIDIIKKYGETQY